MAHHTAAQASQGSKAAIGSYSAGSDRIAAIDYTAWRARFGNTSGAGSSTALAGAVPEPGTFMYLFTAVGGTLCVPLGRRLSRLTKPHRIGKGDQLKNLKWAGNGEGHEPGYGVGRPCKRPTMETLQ